MAATIVIPTDIYNQWMFYVNECPGEVSAMGRITRQGSYYMVNKIYLLPQEVGAAHTDIDAEAICKLMLDTINDKGDLLYWVHSHANMKAFWSGTDLETIRTMGKNGLCVASVFNKAGESRHAICYKTKVEYTGECDVVLYDDISHIIGTPVTEEQKELWRQELRDKVRDKSYVTYPGNMYLQEPMQEEGTTALTEYHQHGDIPFEYEHGIFGFGIEKEARVLGISVAGYRAILDQGESSKSYKNLEESLEKAWEKGKFNAGKK